jgi:arylsulfatase A-like enzyme
LVGFGTRTALAVSAAIVPLAAEVALRSYRMPLLSVGFAEFWVGAGLVLACATAGLVAGGRFAAPVAGFLSVALVVAFAAREAIPSGGILAATPGRLIRWGLLGGAGAAAGLVWALLLARLQARRRGGLAILALASAAIATAATQLTLLPGGLPALERPHVLLVVLDTTRADHLSLYGYPRVTSPNLARLAEEAQIYEKAWSPAPWTPPAHASIFTGLLPAQHGCDGDQVAFDTPAPALAEVLSKAGYRTLGITNNPQLTAERGWGRGFDRWRGIWEESPLSLAAIRQRFERDDEDSLFSGDATRSVQWVRRWWARQGDRPRFVFLNLIDPHSPYGRGDPRVDDRFLDDSTREAEDLPNDSEEYDAGIAVAEGAALARVIARYDAELHFADAALGALLDWLRERGELDHTLVVVTSDHGERLGERGLLGHQLGLEDVLLRVPLLVRHPSLPAGRISSPVQTHGIFDTVLQVVEVAAPPSPFHRVPALSEQTGDLVVAQMRHQGRYVASLRRRSPAFDPEPFAGDWVSVSDTTWKLVASSEGQLRLHRPDLDPSEQRDFAAEQPAVVSRLARKARELPAFDPQRGNSPPEVDEKVRELLRNLGYTE